MEETPENRRRIMQAVRGRDTGPEMIVRRLVHGLGFRYRLHKKGLPGTPDLTFSRRRKIIFVHGCFWHGHECPRGHRQPKTNQDYWCNKIARNVKRDAENVAALKNAGWSILVIWECELRDREELARRIQDFLKTSS